MTVKGHAKQRQREWRKMGHVSTEQTGEANVSGWQQLAQAFEQIGAPVQKGGERFMQASAS